MRFSLLESMTMATTWALPGKRTGEGDLPMSTDTLKDWFSAIDNNLANSIDLPLATEDSLLVSRQEIAESGDHRLTADTYRKIENGMGSSCLGCLCVICLDHARATESAMITPCLFSRSR